MWKIESTVYRAENRRRQTNVGGQNPHKQLILCSGSGELSSHRLFYYELLDEKYVSEVQYPQ